MAPRETVVSGGTAAEDAESVAAAQAKLREHESGARTIPSAHDQRAALKGAERPLELERRAVSCMQFGECEESAV